jgi:hypothetical protein
MGIKHLPTTVENLKNFGQDQNFPRKNKLISQNVYQKSSLKQKKKDSHNHILTKVNGEKKFQLTNRT